MSHDGLPRRCSLAIAVWTAAVTSTSACPFCGVVGESLAERRDRSACVAIAEPAGPVGRDAEGFAEQPFLPLRTLRGQACAEAAVVARVPGEMSGTALLFGSRRRDGAALEWSAVAADEAVIGHVAEAPAIDVDAHERLVWFAARLEHPDPVIAADAFTEFGLAPFDAVRRAAVAFDAAKLRGWVRDGAGDQRRRGFYGLALGLVAAARPTEREASIAVLRGAVAAPADDFRAGFDGLLGGVLVAEGEAGLAWISEQGLFGEAARPVDQRHLLAALRFAWEELAATIPRERVVAATRRLLAAPVVAAEAVVDLARYRDWTAVDEVAGLWDRLGADDPLVRRAVAGYLTACPQPRARQQLDAIRGRDPQRLEAALEAARFPPGR